jgi:hypothetical protein
MRDGCRKYVEEKEKDDEKGKERKERRRSLKFTSPNANPITSPNANPNPIAEEKRDMQLRFGAPPKFNIGFQNSPSQGLIDPENSS